MDIISLEELEEDDDLLEMNFLLESLEEEEDFYDLLDSDLEFSWKEMSYNRYAHTDRWNFEPAEV